MTSPLPSRSTDNSSSDYLASADNGDARFAHLVARAALGIFRASVEGTLLDVNRALAQLLGCGEPAAAVGLALARDVFAQGDEWRAIRARLARGELGDWIDVVWKRRDGSLVEARLSLRAAGDESGCPSVYEGIVEPLAERRRREQVARRDHSLTHVGTAVAGVAHELNNPLAAILGYTQLLLRETSDDRARLALETIHHEAARAGRIVRDLRLLVSSPDGERRGRVSLNDVVCYIGRTRRYALDAHAIACRIELDPAEPAVAGDAMQLEQVVLNLLNNAEQAIRGAGDRGAARGCIVLRTRALADGALLEIEDDGPGLSPEAMERMWDPFWSTKSSTEGTGLGLAVVRGIIAEHGGTISAARSAIGGARLSILLPRLADGRDAPRRALDVLVVDADEHSLNFLTLFLSARGHAPIAVPNLAQAARLGARMRFDAVISDVRLLGDGPAIDAFRGLAGCADARIVLATDDPESTAALPVPLPPRTHVALRPYDLEELRVLLED